MEEWIWRAAAAAIGLLLSWPLKALFKPLFDRIGARIALPAFSEEEKKYVLEYERLNIVSAGIERQLADVSLKSQDKPVPQNLIQSAKVYGEYHAQFDTFISKSYPGSMHSIRNAVAEATTYMSYANNVIQEAASRGNMNRTEQTFFLNCCALSDKWLETTRERIVEFRAQRKPVPSKTVASVDEFDAVVRNMK